MGCWGRVWVQELGAGYGVLGLVFGLAKGCCSRVLGLVRGTGVGAGSGTGHGVLGLGAGCQALGAEAALPQEGQWGSHWEDASPWNYANWAPAQPCRLFTTCTILSTYGEGTHTPTHRARAPRHWGRWEGAQGYRGHWEGALGGGTVLLGAMGGGTGRGHRATGHNGRGHWQGAQATGANGRGHRATGGNGRGRGGTGGHPMALMLAPVPRRALEKQVLLPAAPLHLPVLRAPRGAAMAPSVPGDPRWPPSLTQ